MDVQRFLHVIRIRHKRERISIRHRPANTAHVHTKLPNKATLYIPMGGIVSQFFKEVNTQKKKAALYK